MDLICDLFAVEPLCNKLALPKGCTQVYILKLVSTYLPLALAKDLRCLLMFCKITSASASTLFFLFLLSLEIHVRQIFGTFLLVWLTSQLNQPLMKLFLFFHNLKILER